jgi:hypothetical protein
VALLIPCLRQTSPVFAPPSCSRKIPMICSSPTRLHVHPFPVMDSLPIFGGNSGAHVNLRNRPFLDRKAALARLLHNTETGILFNEHIAEDGVIVFAHTCGPGAEGIVSKSIDGTYRSGPRRV